MSNTADRSHGPLKGLRVIELGTLTAGPFASRLLAEFGAEVIKIEAPNEGDPLRTWRKLHHGASLWWYLQSRNKKSVTINLKSPQGQGIVRRLVKDADVLIENFRPGALEKWGLGWEQLSAVNPNLVMVRISGFGQTGPYSQSPGFGAIAEAMGGIRYTTGSPDRDPARTGISLGDSLASLHAVIGALMGLLAVKTGRARGQVVDVSLAESVLNLMEGLVPEYDLFGVVRERSGAKLPGIAPSSTYRTRDAAWVVIGGNSDSIFRRLMLAIGRVAHEGLIDQAISDWTTVHDNEFVLDALGRAKIPSGRIYTAADIAVDPHYQAREMIVPTRLPDGTQVKMPGIAPKLSETPGHINWLGPELGAHTDVVLKELGFSDAELAELRSAGAI